MSTYTYHEGTSPYGNPELSILVSVPPGPNDWRRAKAEAFRLAALVEEHSSGERWLVHVEKGGNTSARVYIELFRSEAERAKAVLLQALAVHTSAHKTDGCYATKP